MQQVKITTLEGVGDLELNGSAVTLNAGASARKWATAAHTWRSGRSANAIIAVPLSPPLMVR